MSAPGLVQDDNVGSEQLEQWMARLEAAQDRMLERLSLHESRPWHVSFDPWNAEMMRRVDRLEGVVISIGRWTIGALLAILAALGAILTVAWRILEAKPPG